MTRTRVGYAGGARSNPTYHDLGDHTETVEVEYDPSKIGYADLLRVFWDSHAPVVPAWSRQYQSVVFFHDDVQKRLALESRDARERELGRKLYTELRPASKFYPAEDYHQKYALRRVKDVMLDLRRAYPREEDFVSSTAAARLNGFVSGYGTAREIEAEIPGLGLSEKGEAAVRRFIAGSAERIPAACPLPKSRG